MTKKRVIIVTAVGGNALVLFVPSAALLIWVWRDIGATSDPFELLALVVINVVTIPLLVLSGFNLWCVRSAWVLRGEKRAKAIEMGLISCVVLALTGLVLTPIFLPPIPMLVLCPIAYATATTLRHARAESKRGWFCPKCDYDLQGLAGIVCPECGLQVRPEAGT